MEIRLKGITAVMSAAALSVVLSSPVWSADKAQREADR
jgi:hypothetical protein